jgi:hypothetical protein
MKDYKIGQKYRINPFGQNTKWNHKFQRSVPYDGDDAEFVGWIRLKNKEKLPVFKFNFYSHGDPTCFVVLENGKWVVGGNNVEQMMQNFHREIDYFGKGYEFVTVGNNKLSIDDFTQQALEAGVPDDHIEESIKTGFYYTAYSKNGGEIKWCPSCNKIRKTDCGACGCGSCSVCGERWTCMPVVNLPNFVSVKPFSETVVKLSEAAQYTSFTT